MGLADIQQSPRQRCRHTGTDNQGRNGAHQKIAKQMPPFEPATPVKEIIFYRTWQLQLIKAEHGERQHHKNKGARDQGSRRLQCIAE
ncbi:hypothetical protein D3C87_1980320 [compost metagenome]